MGDVNGMEASMGDSGVIFGAKAKLACATESFFCSFEPLDFRGFFSAEAWDGVVNGDK